IRVFHVTGVQTCALPISDVETHQRTDIGAQTAVMGRHENTVPDAGQAHRDLFDARVERPRGTVDTLQQLHLLGAAHDVQRVAFGVELSHLRADKCLYPALLAGAGNRACSLRGLGQSIETDRVAVGEAGFLAGLGAYANALIEVETAFLDDAILENPGFRDLALEVQI